MSHDNNRLLDVTESFESFEQWQERASALGYQIYRDSIFRDHYVAHVGKPYTADSRGMFDKSTGENRLHSSSADAPTVEEFLRSELAKAGVR